MLIFPGTGTAYKAANGVQWVMEGEVFIFISEQQPQQSRSSQVRLTFKATTEITLLRLYSIWMAKSFI